MTFSLVSDPKASGSMLDRRGILVIKRVIKRVKQQVLWCSLPRDVRTESLFANYWVFRIKPLTVELLAGEQKATEFWFPHVSFPFLG